MQAQDQVVDHLADLPCTDAVAEVIDRGRERLKCRTAALERRLVAAADDEERPAREGLAAAQRNVERHEALLPTSRSPKSRMPFGEIVDAMPTIRPRPSRPRSTPLLPEQRVLDLDARKAMITIAQLALCRKFRRTIAEGSITP